MPEKGRLIVFAFGDESSGIPPGWTATDERPGIDLLPDLSEATARGVLERVGRVKRARDIVVASIHWGSNWGYQVPPAQQRFAQRLLDGEVDIVHGHSSHHIRPIEHYRGKLILYGCGDFLDDYEGIAGYEEFRDDLTLMYFPTVEPNLSASVTYPTCARSCSWSAVVSAGEPRSRLPLERVGAAPRPRVAAGP
jgi:poly-gamma-glutamate synthesis protein (capsule biosynthesis protein)